MITIGRRSVKYFFKHRNIILTYTIKFFLILFLTSLSFFLGRPYVGFNPLLLFLIYFYFVFYSLTIIRAKPVQLFTSVSGSSPSCDGDGVRLLFGSGRSHGVALRPEDGPGLGSATGLLLPVLPESSGGPTKPTSG